MIAWLGLAFAAPSTVVVYDNGGFSLPLYTTRWNGEFSQPSVAQQLAADIARLRGDLRVFTYLPPGSRPGRSSDPFEVHAHRPGCSPSEGPLPAGDPCACAPGDRCWTSLDLNRDPSASTSLFQAATAVRERVPGPRIEVHVTDLFEEDPSSAEDPADADRCVTAESTRKALEALLSPSHGALDHVAVGVLRARVDPPRQASGGITSFVEAEGGCWTGRRSRVFGPGEPADVAVAVVVLGIDTAADDASVRAFVDGLARQVSGPLALDLVMVREPPVALEIPPRAVLPGESLALPPIPPRSTPCGVPRASAEFTAAGFSVPGALSFDGGCGDRASVAMSLPEVRRIYRRVAGLDPRVGTLTATGRVRLVGEVGAVRAAVVGLADRAAAADRPLVFWGALVDALRFDAPAGVGAWRPWEVDVQVRELTLRGLDDRPWGVAGALGVFLALVLALVVHRLLWRVSAERAFRRHLGAAGSRPIASVIAEAQEEARASWGRRLLVALGIGSGVGAVTAVAVIWAHGVLGG